MCIELLSNSSHPVRAVAPAVPLRPLPSRLGDSSEPYATVSAAPSMNPLALRSEKCATITDRGGSGGGGGGDAAVAKYRLHFS